MTTNWAGNLRFHASDRVQPRSVEEVARAVQSAPRVHAIGSAHSFSDVADTDGVHIDVSHLDIEPELRDSAATPTVVAPAGWTYWRLSTWLHERGFALRNLASLPHISIAGSIATGTHGSGARNQSLAAHTVGLELIDAGGNVRTLARGDAEFAGAVISLGLLGIVTRVELEIVPAFDIAQYVTLDVPLPVVQSDPASILARGYSTSIFTTWASPDVIDAVWVKTPGAAVHIEGGTPATRDVHPISGLDATSATAQLGVLGPSHERVPHFRPQHTPSAGAELQSEFFVAAEDAAAVFDVLREFAPQFASILLVNEIRAIAKDDLWLSGTQGRDTVAFHFTWALEPEPVIAALTLIENAVARFDARPHWGKVTSRTPEQIVALYPRWRDFITLRASIDPDGRFLGAFGRRFISVVWAQSRRVMRP